jgi:hypothetical protein
MAPQNVQPEWEDGRPPEPFYIKGYDNNPGHESDHEPTDNIPVPAFLVSSTVFLVPFCKQRRVFPVEIQDCRKTEKNEPDTEGPDRGPEEISGKKEDEGGKYKDVQEREDGLLLPAYCIGDRGYYETVFFKRGIRRVGVLLRFS